MLKNYYYLVTMILVDLHGIYGYVKNFIVFDLYVHNSHESIRLIRKEGSLPGMQTIVHHQFYTKKAACQVCKQVCIISYIHTRHFALYVNNCNSFLIYIQLRTKNILFK